MTSKTPQQLLREAAPLIAAAVQLLDIEEHACEHCHVKKFDNFAHAKVFRAFADTPGKLLDAADRLDEKDKHENAGNDNRR